MRREVVGSGDAESDENGDADEIDALLEGAAIALPRTNGLCSAW